MKKLRKTATLLRQLEPWLGDARLYRLSDYAEYNRSDYTKQGNNKKGRTKYVVVSATTVSFFGPETYIFPSDAHGETLNMLEMAGSFRGGLDHTRALKSLGFSVVK